MKSGSLRSDRLGKRDRSILADAVRYRLVTNEIVHRCYLPEANINAATKITLRLANLGLLERHSLFDSRVYFVPGKRLCKQIGLPESRCRPLGVQTLAGSLSVANYCQLSPQRYKLVDSRDYSSGLAWIPEKLRSLPYAIENSADQQIVRLLRVDFGGAPSHVAMKCAEDVAARTKIEGFRNLLKHRQFVFVVLTTTDIKRQLIMRSIQKRIWPTNMRFEIVVIQDLSNLLTQ